MIESIFHINVNCTNFDRSLEFYQTLGFKVIRDLNEVGSEQLSRGLRIPNGRGRAEVDGLLQVARPASNAFSCHGCCWHL